MSIAGNLCAAKGVGSLMFHREAVRGMPGKALLPAPWLLRWHDTWHGSDRGGGSIDDCEGV